ncbi:MAG: hypothetical protein ABIV26_06890 [Candidatus Limnocylindrales bacterium]
MPVFDADAPASGALRRPFGDPGLGRRPARRRGLGIAFVALLLLIGGVALGAVVDRPPDASPLPSGLAASSGGPSGSAAPSASTSPSATDIRTPTQRPLETADFPCGPQPVEASAVSLVLQSGDGAPAEGAIGGPGLAKLEAQLGARVDLDVADHACATSWEIEVQNVDDDSREYHFVGANPEEDPAVAVQNHWRFIALSGTAVVRATLRFGHGLVVIRTWSLRTAPFAVPPLFLVGVEDRRVEAIPGCGLSVQVGSLSGSPDPCAGSGYVAGEPLRVPAGTVVTLELEGWVIVGWDSSYGRILDGAAQEFEPFGSLGGYNAVGLDAAPGPARFVARAGETVVQLSISGGRSGEQFQVPYYATVVGE